MLVLGRNGPPAPPQGGEISDDAFRRRLPFVRQSDIFSGSVCETGRHQDPNATFYAYHGVASDEQNLGGKFEIDVEPADLSSAPENDDLQRTVDYEKVYARSTRS